jgi:hypothetical protein
MTMFATASPAEIVLAAFTVANVFQIVSYVPQIVCVARDRNGASAIAYSTWLIWLAGSAATTAYAMVNIWDIWLAVVNAVHSVCCIAVVALTAWKRNRLQAPPCATGEHTPPGFPIPAPRSRAWPGAGMHAH